LLAGNERALISALDVGVAVCSALGFLVGSSASMTPEILERTAVAESARAGGFGPRAVRRGFLRRVASVGFGVIGVLWFARFGCG
jgi:hypothetical protein